MKIQKLSKWILGWVILGLMFTAGCSGMGLGPRPTATPEVEANDAVAPVVSATGMVKPVRWATLSAAAAGEIETILVSEGQPVQEGDVLVRLAGSDKLQTAITAAEAEEIAARQELKTLQNNAAQARAQAQLRLSTAEKALDEASKRRSWKEYRNGSQTAIDQAQADFILAKDALEKAEDIYSYVADNSEEDVNRAAGLSALSAARKAYDRALANLNYLLAMPKAVDVNQAEAELQAAQAEVENAQQALEKLKDGPDPDAVALAEARIKNAEAQLESGRLALADLEIKAPFSGTVTDVLARAGEWASPGQQMLLLADLTTLRIETTDLSEIDVARVKTGDTADVTFDALPDVTAHARVTAVAEKASEGSGVNYPVTLELETLPDGLRWGMTAFVDIRVGD
jgi:multidrug efflux pump subunit AcrA (membrane-fusion protein)